MKKLNIAKKKVLIVEKEELKPVFDKQCENLEMTNHRVCELLTMVIDWKYDESEITKEEIIRRLGKISNDLRHIINDNRAWDNTLWG